MLQMKVPFLRPPELDHAAAELLRDYAKWRSAEARPPIDVEEILESYLGLVLELKDLRDLLGLDGVLGATWFDDRRVCIDHSLEGKEGRFAFTVAHEIAHWQLHRPLYEMAKVTLPLFPSHPGAKPAPAVVCRAQDKRVPAEWQADQFAARLLMPASEVRTTVRSLRGEETPAWDGLEARRKAGVLDPRLRSFADEVISEGGFSNASNEAMCYRLFDLELVRDAAQMHPRLL